MAWRTRSATGYEAHGVNPHASNAELRMGATGVRVIASVIGPRSAVLSASIAADFARSGMIWMSTAAFDREPDGERVFIRGIAEVVTRIRAGDMVAQAADGSFVAAGPPVRFIYDTDHPHAYDLERRRFVPVAWR